MLVLSVLLHTALGLVFFWSPSLSRSPSPLAGAVMVELVAAAPGSAPAARPAPRRAPPRKTVVLPKEPKALAKPKPRPARKAKPAPKPTQQKSLDDVMRELQRKAGPADEVARPQQVARAGAVAGSAGSGTARVDPATAGWLRRARIHVRRGWVLAPGFRTQELEAHVKVRLDAQGNIVGKPRITQRSGNPWYDDSVMRAIEKASPLPAPPEAGEWPFIFRPEDLL